MALHIERLGLLALAAALALGCDTKDDGSDAGDDDALVEGGDQATGGMDDEDPPSTGEAPGDTEDEPASTTTMGGEPPPGGTDGPEDEPCEVQGESRDCAGGIQYCDGLGSGSLVWGECLANPECTPGDFEHCGFCPDFGDSGGSPDDECPGFGNTCRLVDGVPMMPGDDDSECNTPLVLSFDGAPIDLGPAAASTFDINDTGACLSTDWPAATTPWLALDLDRSGTIESGRELFGSGTRLPSGRRAANGFAALELLDDNHDGRIDASDRRFDELVLWADHDADKTATLAELTPVAMRGILSIDLGYTVSPRCDDRGNCEMQRAGFKYVDRGGEVRDGEIVDLYLSCQ